MRQRLSHLLGAAWTGLLTACASPPATLGEARPADEGEPAHIVYIVSNGWHTGIILDRRDLPPDVVPEAEDFPAALYLEFGWGDREYYPTPRPTVGMALAAALTPTPAVMHLAGLAQPPRRQYPLAELLAIPLTAPALDRLASGIAADFERPEGGRAETIAPGLYRDSLFYPAHGSFHLFNTCNTWTARQLAAAGLALSPSGVVTADELMKRLRALPGVTNMAVRHIDEGDPEVLLQGCHRRLHPHPQVGGQGAQGFVEQQDRRLRHQHACKRHPLPQATRQLVDSAVSEVGNLHALQ